MSTESRLKRMGLGHLIGKSEAEIAEASRQRSEQLLAIAKANRERAEGESHQRQNESENAMSESQFHQAQMQITSALEQMGASVLLITQSGEIVFVSDTLKTRDRNWLGGQALEVMVTTPGISPYFIYYENEGYYLRMASPQQSLSNTHDYAEYRSNVSQALCMLLILHLMKNHGKDIRHPQMSFSHNRIHTNVIAYVDKLKNWYPIQHNSQESDFATEQKVAKVNRGEVNIKDVIAIHAPSPA